MPSNLKLLGWALIATSLPAVAAPLRVGRPYYMQIEAPAPETTSDAGRRAPPSPVCQVNRGPPPDAVDRVFVQSGCRPSDQQLTRWDPARQRMIPAADIKSKPLFVSPAALLDLHAWAPAAAFVDGPSRSAAGDYEVVLKSPGSGPQRSRVVIRSGAWQRTEDVDWQGRQSLTIQNLDIGISLSIRRNAQTRTLAIRGPSPIFPPPPPFTPPRVHSQQDAQVLGETCSWWDLMPGVYDAGLWECRAPDGAPLAQRHFGRGGPGDDIFAVEVHRGRVPLARVLPSKAEVSAKLFGLFN